MKMDNMNKDSGMADKPEKLELGSQNIARDKREELLRLFPEVRTEDGKLDFERLKLALGETVDVGKERYGMNLGGKGRLFQDDPAAEPRHIAPVSGVVTT